MPKQRQSSTAAARVPRWGRGAAAVLLVASGVQLWRTTGRAAGASAVGPALKPGGPTSSAWREEVLTKAQELDALATWLRAARGNPDRRADEFRRSIEGHLAAARETAADEDDQMLRRERWQASWTGSSIERATGHLEAVEAHLLRLAPPDYIRGEMPSVKAYVARFLPKDDPRRARVEQLTLQAETEELPEVEREAVVAAYHAASSQRRRELMRVRSFRNVLLIAALLLLLVVVCLGVLGSIQPQAIPLCFEPESGQGTTVVCPTGQSPLGERTSTR